jgi:hypothetical protein
VVGKARFHRRGLAVRRMDAAEVEMGNLNQHGPSMVVQFLGVPERLAGEAAVKQPHAEILSLHMVHSGQTHLWETDASFAPNRFADDGIVAPPETARMQWAVGLNFRRVVNFIPENGLHSVCIGVGVLVKAVAGQLELLWKLEFQSAQELASVRSVALADMDVENQLGCAVDGDECVLVTAQHVVLAGVLLKAADKAENLVYLNVADLDVFDLVGHKLLAMLASGLKHVQDSVFAKPGEPAYGADADAFTEHLDYLRGFPGLDPDAVQWLSFGKGLAAPHAAEPLDIAVHILEAPEPLRFPVTTIARHSCLWRAGWVKAAANRKIQQLLALPPLVAAWRVLQALAEPLFHLRENFTKGSWTLAVQAERFVKIYSLEHQWLMQNA